jgi:hypothetical protein
LKRTAWVILGQKIKRNFQEKEQKKIKKDEV